PGPILDLKQIKQIIELMKRAELSEFAFEEEGFKLKIRRGGSAAAGNGRGSNPPFVFASDPAGYPTAPALPTAAPAPAPAQSGPVATGAAADAEEAGVTYIKSPMVGTFYSAPSPDSKPFAD